MRSIRIVCAALALVFGASSADASVSKIGRATPATDDASIATAEKVVASAVNATQGIVINDRGAAEVLVTNDAAAQTVRSLGGTPRLVQNGEKNLLALSTELEPKLQSAPGVYGISVDPIRDRVLVRSTAADAENVRALVNDPRVEVVVGDPSSLKAAKTMYAGLSMSGCTAGFNGIAWSRTVMLTVGHCLPSNGSAVYSSYRGSSQRYGVALSNLWKNEGYDAGLVDFDADVSTPPYVLNRSNPSTTITVSGYTNLYGGSQVCKHAASTGYTCGYVTDVGARVFLSGVWLRGMVGTTMCVWAGDSGGPVLQGRGAAALVSHYDSSMSCSWNSGWSNAVPVSDSRRSWHTDMSVFRQPYYNATVKSG